MLCKVLSEFLQPVGPLPLPCNMSASVWSHCESWSTRYLYESKRQRGAYV